MRVPFFKVTCDDVNERPFAVSLQTLYENDPETFDAVYTNVNPTAWIPRFVPLAVGCSVTVGGGADVQWTLTRIR